MLNKIVYLINEDWRTNITRILAIDGVVRLVAEHTRLPDLKKAILELVATPLEVGYLHVYPQVEGVVKTSTSYSVLLSLQEAVQ